MQKDKEITLSEQIKFIEHQRDEHMTMFRMLNKNNPVAKKYSDSHDIFVAVIESLQKLSNGQTLQKCFVCGESFEASATKKFCSTRCRVKNHRAEKELQNFTDKVKRALPIDAKFGIQTLIVSPGECPFQVTYKNEEITGKTKREILTKLKKL